MTRTGSRDAPASVTASTSSAGRILAIDAARAVAIIGMLAINVGPRDDPGFLGRLYALPHGRASLLFVLIAGVGVSLLTRRARSGAGLGRAWATLLWRSAILLLAGLALQRLDHEVSVILPTYALLFVIAGLVLRAPDAALLVGALALVVVGPGLWLGAQLSIGATYAYEPAALGDPPGQVLHSLVLSGPYPLITWSAPFLFGMWLGRQDLTAAHRQRAMMLGGGAAAVAAPALAAGVEAVVGGPADELDLTVVATSVAHGQMPLWLVGGTGSAVFLLGLCLRGSSLMRGALWPLVAAGQLALTIYVVHLFVLDWLRPAPHDLAEGALITVAMTAAALVLATVWRAVLPRGPLEVLVRPPWTWRRR